MKQYLLTPGPTPIPPKILKVLSKPIIHHRTPQFQQILKEVTEGLKYVFQTKNDVFIFCSSGTGAMEVAVANLLSPGDRAITVESGKFGERWTEICNNFGIDTEVIRVEWGKSVLPEEIKARLSSKIKAVFTTFCETSTGVTQDMERIGKLVKETDAVLVTDAISGLGVIPLETDNWSCDVIVSGSQKGLMLPPGLSFISVSPKAWKMIENSKSPKYYFDLKETKKAMDKTDTPFTPAITLIIALRESLKMIKEEGLEIRFKKFKRMAEAVREAIDSIGLELFAQKNCASDAITAVKVPTNIDGEKLVKIMRNDFGVWIAEGQAELKGKIFRIAHMGYIKESDLIKAVSVLEEVLSQLGYKFEKGRAIRVLKDNLKRSLYEEANVRNNGRKDCC